MVLPEALKLGGAHKLHEPWGSCREGFIGNLSVAGFETEVSHILWRMFWENPYRGAFPKPTTALVFEFLKGGEPKFLHYITRDIRASGLDLIRALRGPLAEKFRNSKREIGIEFKK